MATRLFWRRSRGCRIQHPRPATIADNNKTRPLAREQTKPAAVGWHLAQGWRHYGGKTGQRTELQGELPFIVRLLHVNLLLRPWPRHDPIQSQARATAACGGGKGARRGEGEGVAMGAERDWGNGTITGGSLDPSAPKVSCQNRNVEREYVRGRDGNTGASDLFSPQKRCLERKIM